jgi:hypothetical protein
MTSGGNESDRAVGGKHPHMICNPAGTDQTQLAF